MDLFADRLPLQERDARKQAEEARKRAGEVATVISGRGKAASKRGKKASITSYMYRRGCAVIGTGRMRTAIQEISGRGCTVHLYCKEERQESKQ